MPFAYFNFVQDVYKLSTFIYHSYSLCIYGPVRSTSDALPTVQPDAQPAHFYLGAAHAAIERRRAAQRARELRPPGATSAAALQVSPGAYVGQYVMREAQKRLTEEEFLQFLEVGIFHPLINMLN